MSTKEQYWKYSLIVIILFMGVIIFRQITPFLGGLLGALTIYILVRGQMMTPINRMKTMREYFQYCSLVLISCKIRLYDNKHSKAVKGLFYSEMSI